MGLRVGAAWALAKIGRDIRGTIERSLALPFESLGRKLAAGHGQVSRLTVEEAKQADLRVYSRLREELVASVPLLVDALADARARSSVARTLGGVPEAKEAAAALATVLRDEKAPLPIRKCAAWVLAEIGPDAKEAIPGLIAVVADGDLELRVVALMALAQNVRGVDTAGEPLMEALRKHWRNVLQNAKMANGGSSSSDYFGIGEGVYYLQLAHTLAAIGPTVIPTLTRALEDEREFFMVSRSAATALGLIGPEAIPTLAAITRRSTLNEMSIESLGNAFALVGPPAVPTLRELLHDVNGSARRVAVAALAAMSGDCPETLPLLQQVSQDKDASVRVAALPALARASDQPLRVLAEALDDADQRVRITAASALTNAGSPAIPILIKALHNADSNVRRTVGDRLVAFPPEELAVIVPDLVAALKDGNSRLTAVRALEQAGARAQPAIPAVVELLRDPEFNTREHACNVLAAIGAPAAVAVPDLARLVDNDEEYQQTRRAAARALGEIGPAAESAIPILIEALHDENQYSNAQGEACSALARIGLASVPALTQALRDEKPVVRLGAVVALGNLGKNAESTIPELLKSLQDEIPFVRSSAANALGQICSSSDNVVPALIRTIQADKVARCAAISALRKCGAAAATAVPALRHVSEDAKENPYTRGLAREAVTCIESARDAAGRSAGAREAATGCTLIPVPRCSAEARSRHPVSAETFSSGVILFYLQFWSPSDSGAYNPELE